jgi:hypothetical protein
MVKLETTKNRRRLHIGSFFSDLNETDYQELIRIFTNENVVKNLSSNPVLADSLPLSGKEIRCEHCNKLICDDDTTT